MQEGALVTFTLFDHIAVSRFTHDL